MMSWNEFGEKNGRAVRAAAALEWSAGIPHGKKFLARDQKLQEAAILTGFEAE